jgi:tetratricopeptide (TPR) repeat protein
MSFHSLKSLSFSLLPALLLAIPAFSQVTGVEGLVKGPDGAPVKGAVVTFDRTDIKGHYTVKTDKKGHYGHYGLPYGTYDVTVAIDGKQVDGIKGLKTKLGDPMEQNFDLKASQQQQQAAQQAAASGKLTDEQARGMSKEQREQFEKTAKAREAQLAKNKALNEAYTNGKNELEAKQYDQAIENLTKASEMDPNQVAVWSALADAYSGAAQQKPTEAATLWPKCFDAYQKAIALKPDDASYYNNYALALAKDKKMDDARTNLEKAAQLDPPGAGKYYYNMGALLVNTGQSDQALEQFKKAIASDPNYADAQYQYGVAMAGKATTDKSGKIIAPPGTIEALQKYLDLKPDGSYAESAKELIAQLGGTVSTTYQNPNAPKGKKKK